MQYQISTEVAVFLVGFFIVNAGALLSAYISIRVAVAKLEVKVDTLSSDTNRLGGMVRELKFKTIGVEK